MAPDLIGSAVALAGADTKYGLGRGSPDTSEQDCAWQLYRAPLGHNSMAAF
jgi:hypothetical protein